MSSKWDPSKWELHRLYSKHSGLRKRLPPTTVLSRNSLSQYLEKYGEVYIKGKNEHTGSGIIKAWKTDTGYRFVKEKGKPADTESISDLFRKVKNGRRRQSVLVQKAIDLATIEGRPFSVRLMLMRDGKRKWQYAGMLAKVAGEGSIISNVRRGGGYAATIDYALSKSLNYDDNQIDKMKRKLVRIGYDFIEHAIKHGYRSHEAGIDLGIDKKGKIWIIEVNLIYPSYGVFNKIEDKTFYRKIRRLAAAYKKRRPS